jgi:hypothetical protein
MSPEYLPMSRDSACLTDPALLAAEVRSLATEAHQVLKDPRTSSHAADELARRIGTLQQQVGGRSAGDLGLWLENLRRTVGRAQHPAS